MDTNSLPVVEFWDHKIDQQKCDAEGCEASPGFYLPYTDCVRCAEHRVSGMIRIGSFQCLFGGCNEEAIYNLPGSTPGLLCFLHRLPEMTRADGGDEYCIVEGCDDEPYFNHPGLGATRCVVHATKGMINVRANGSNAYMVDFLYRSDEPTGPNRHLPEFMTCRELYGCAQRLRFSEDGLKPATHCARHRTIRMLCVYRPVCIIDGCGRPSRYNYIGRTRGIRCWSHKHPDHIDITKSRCTTRGCKNRPAFINPGDIKRGRCVAHVEKGMIQLHPRRQE